MMGGMSGMPDVEAPRWRRLEPDARREQILECAVRLFGERPYSAVSTSEIAREAGVARGLLNHYFGTKRDLYIAVVHRLVFLPELDSATVGSGSLRQRVERSVEWFLDTVIGTHGRTFVAVIGAEGVGGDPEIEQILAEADDLAAQKVLQTLGVHADVDSPAQVAAIRAYGGMVKAAVREWVQHGALTRDQVKMLLSRSLLTIVRDVVPELAAQTTQPTKESP
jgi:AcrR family transcriptional regulator